MVAKWTSWIRVRILEIEQKQKGSRYIRVSDRHKPSQISRMGFGSIAQRSRSVISIHALLYRNTKSLVQKVSQTNYEVIRL